MHLEGSEREDGGDEGGLGVLALGKEGETTDGHQDEGDGGRQARGKLVDVTDEETEEGDAPVEERWLVGDVASVVDRQYPVAMLQHGVGYDCLAWLALRIEVGETEEWYQHQDSKDADIPECFFVLGVHIDDIYSAAKVLIKVVEMLKF